MNKKSKLEKDKKQNPDPQSYVSNKDLSFCFWLSSWKRPKSGNKNERVSVKMKCKIHHWWDKIKLVTLKHIISAARFGEDQKGSKRCGWVRNLMAWSFEKQERNMNEESPGKSNNPNSIHQGDRWWKETDLPLLRSPAWAHVSELGSSKGYSNSHIQPWSMRRTPTS